MASSAAGTLEGDGMGAEDVYYRGREAKDGAGQGRGNIMA